MVNQEKVRLMARAEWYRQRERRRALNVNRYSKGAYVSTQIVKSLIFCTVGAGVCVIMWAIYHADELLTIYDFNRLLAIGRQVLIMYAAALVIAAAVSWRSYLRKYTKARSSVKKYYTLLRKINHFNEKDRRRLTAPDQPVKKEDRRL